MRADDTSTLLLSECDWWGGLLVGWADADVHILTTTLTSSACPHGCEGVSGLLRPSGWCYARLYCHYCCCCCCCSCSRSCRHRRTALPAAAAVCAAAAAACPPRAGRPASPRASEWAAGRAPATARTGPPREPRPCPRGGCRCCCCRCCCRCCRCCYRCCYRCRCCRYHQHYYPHRGGARAESAARSFASAPRPAACVLCYRTGLQNKQTITRTQRRQPHGYT
jgi:hypothetical protein